jgi:hypothetical protein
VLRFNHDLGNRVADVGSFMEPAFKKSWLRDVFNVTPVKDKSSDYGS